MFGGGGNAELSLEALNAQLRQLNAALVKVRCCSSCWGAGLDLVLPPAPAAAIRRARGVCVASPAAAQARSSPRRRRRRRTTPALLQPPTADLTVADANSAWLAPRAALQPAYAAALQAGFGAKAAPIASAAEINGWVSEATRGCIKEIVDEGAVRQASAGGWRGARLGWRVGRFQERCTARCTTNASAFLFLLFGPLQAILILINCVYFKGLWTHQFDKCGGRAQAGQSISAPAPLPRLLRRRAACFAQPRPAFPPPCRHGTHGADFHPLQHGAPPLRAATMFRVFKGKTAVRFAPALPAATPGGAAFECAAVQLPYRGDEFYGAGGWAGLLGCWVLRLRCFLVSGC